MSDAYERERQNNSRLDELSAKVSALRGVTIDIYDNARDQGVIDSTVRVPPTQKRPTHALSHMRFHMLFSHTCSHVCSKDVCGKDGVLCQEQPPPHAPLSSLLSPASLSCLPLLPPHPAHTRHTH
jgi:hypothetical protein